MASTIKSGNNNNFNVFSTNSSVFDSSLSNNFKLNIKEKEDDIVFVNDNTSVYQNLSIDELKQQLTELEKKSNFNSLKGLDNTQVEADIKLIRRIYEDKGNQIISIRSLDEKISDIDEKIQTYVDNNDKVKAEDLKNKKKSYEFLKSIINKTNKTYFSYEELINDISTDVLTICYDNNDFIFDENLFKEKYKDYEIGDFYNLLIDNPSATDDPLLLFKAQKYVYANNIEIINKEHNEKKKYLQSEYLSIDSSSIDSSKSNFMMLALLSKIDSSYNDISLQELKDVPYTVNDDYKMYLSQYQQYISFLSDEEIKKIFELSKKDSQSVNDYIFLELNITERVAKGTDVFYDNESRIKSIQTLVANEYKEKYNYVFPEEDYKKNYQNYSIAMQTEFQVESNYNFQMLQNEDFTTYLKSEDIQNILNKEHKKVENIDKYAENYDKIAYYLSDDEKRVYYYRLKKYGENNAKKYLSFLKSAVRMRAGQEEAQKRLEIFKTGEDEQGNPIYDFSKYYTVGSTAILTAMGFDDGVENFFVGLKNCFYADKEQTCFDYEKMFIMEALTSDKKKGSFFGQELAYEFGTSMGNMAPVIITSMALQAVPFIGQTAVPGLVSTIGMGASSFGNNKHDLYLQGYDGYKMYMRAAMGAMSEVALEKFLGTIPGISVVNKTAEASAVGADKNLVKFLKYILLNSAKEGIEESSQVIVDSLMDSILLGNEFSIDFEELVKSGILGALSGGITNATTIGISKLPININGMKCTLETALIDKFGVTNDRLLDLHYKTALAEVMTLCDENTRTPESIEKAANVMEKAGFKDVADNIRTIDIINNKNSETNNSVSQNFNESNSSVKIDENIEVLEVGNNIADNKNNNIENANAEVSIETIQTNINNADSNEISDFLANNKIDKVLEVVSNMSESEINAMVSKIPLNSYYEFYKKLGSSDIFTKLTPENLNHVTKLLYLSPKTFKLMSLNENFIEAIVKGDSSNIDTIMHADGIVELQTKLKEKMKSVNNQDVSLNDEIEIPKLSITDFSGDISQSDLKTILLNIDSKSSNKIISNIDTDVIRSVTDSMSVDEIIKIFDNGYDIDEVLSVEKFVDISDNLDIKYISEYLKKALKHMDHSDRYLVLLGIIEKNCNKLDLDTLKFLINTATFDGVTATIMENLTDENLFTLAQQTNLQYFFKPSIWNPNDVKLCKKLYDFYNSRGEDCSKLADFIYVANVYSKSGVVLDVNVQKDNSGYKIIRSDGSRFEISLVKKHNIKNEFVYEYLYKDSLSKTTSTLFSGINIDNFLTTNNTKNIFANDFLSVDNIENSINKNYGFLDGCLTKDGNYVNNLDTLLFDNFFAMNYENIFKSAFFDSDSLVIEKFLEPFSKHFKENNMDEINLLKTYIRLKQENPDLKLIVTPSDLASRWIWSDKRIILDNEFIQLHDTGTLAHESGHLLFSLVSNEFIDDNIYNKLINKTQLLATKNKKIMEKYIKTVEKTVNKLTKKNVNTINKQIELFKIAFQQEKGIRDVFNSYRKLYSDEYAKIRNSIYRLDFSEATAISDMYCGMFLGTGINNDGKNIFYNYSHKYNYYNTIYENGVIRKRTQSEINNIQFHEMIAHYIKLKRLGKNDSIKLLSDVFGKDYISFLENYYQSFVNYAKK